MWLERSVMFPTLHSTIRDVLVSDEATKVQFILEPLAFPQLANCYYLHGQRFIEQLSYLTRTFAFYIHREYQKILKLAQNNPPPIEPLNDLNCSPTNPISVSAHPGSPPSTTHTSKDLRPQLTSARHVQYQLIVQPGHCHGGAPPSTRNSHSEWCDQTRTGTTYAQHRISANTVQLNRVTASNVSPMTSQSPAAPHAPDVHELCTGCVPVGGGGLGGEAGKDSTVANITY